MKSVDSDLLQQVRANLLERDLIRRGQKVLVAVSGGLDSMVLLDLLYRLAPEFKLKLAVAHFNHRLRGRSSAADQQHVQRTCTRLGIPFFVERSKVAELARAAGVSVEMAGRTARHEFFARTAIRERVGCVALAHHADDQVELFFLRLLRGAGPEALGGMKWRAASSVDSRVLLVRPLLDCTRAALSEYARVARIRFRLDESNDNTKFERNRIRQVLLPLLREKFQPAVDSSVLRLMEVAAAEGEFCVQATESWLAAKGFLRNPPATDNAGGAERPDLEASSGGYVFKMDLELLDFAKLPLPIQRQAMRLQLLRLGLLPDFNLVERLRIDSDSWNSAGRACWVRRDRQGRVEIDSGVGSEQFGKLAVEINLVTCGEVSFDGVVVRWELKPATVGFARPGPRDPMEPRNEGTEVFDADCVGPRIILRHWRVGDRFQPIGMEHSIKVQDFFVNQKVLRKERHRLVLCTTSAGEVFWIEGLRISERFKLTKHTRKQLHWSWHRL